jgi:hypothetical protein
VTTRYERLKMQRRMQRRIRLVVEERRMALARKPPAVEEPPSDAETTVEIPPLATLVSAPAPIRAIGRVTITSA